MTSPPEGRKVLAGSSSTWMGILSNMSLWSTSLVTSPPEGGRSSTHRARARATWRGRPQALHTLEGGWLGQKCHMYTVPETRVGRRSLCPSQARPARHTRTRNTKQARTKAGARARTRHSEAHTHARGCGAGAAHGALCMPRLCTRRAGHTGTRAGTGTRARARGSEQE